MILIDVFLATACFAAVSCVGMFGLGLVIVRVWDWLKRRWRK